jgi:hypothetical protein
MTPSQVEQFQRLLNTISPYDVWKALHRLDRHPLRGPETSLEVITGDAAEFDLGVTVRRTAEDLYAVRIAFPAPPGLDRVRGQRREFMYDALFMTPASLPGFAAALTATLRDRGKLSASPP